MGESDSMEDESSVDDEYPESTSMESDDLEEEDSSSVEISVDDEDNKSTSMKEEDSSVEMSVDDMDQQSSTEGDSMEKEVSSFVESRSSVGLPPNSSAEKKTSSKDDSSSQSGSSAKSSVSTFEGGNPKKVSSTNGGSRSSAKGGLYKGLIITFAVLMAIVVCLTIMECKRRRDKGKRSLKHQMLVSDADDTSDGTAINVVYKEKKHDAKSGPDYKAFNDLV